MAIRRMGPWYLLIRLAYSTATADELVLEKNGGSTADGCPANLRVSSAFVSLKKFRFCSLQKDGGAANIKLGEIRSSQDILLSPAFGTGFYFVDCKIAIKANGTPTTGMKSQPVFVEFFGTAPQLQQVIIQPNEIFGGNPQTDKSLTLTVKLDKPAGPCGIDAAVYSSKPNIARLTVGNGGIYMLRIPGGKQTETLSWFLGTKKNKNGKAEIMVKLGTGIPGSASLTVK